MEVRYGSGGIEHVAIGCHEGVPLKRAWLGCATMWRQCSSRVYMKIKAYVFFQHFLFTARKRNCPIKRGLRKLCSQPLLDPVIFRLRIGQFPFHIPLVSQNSHFYQFQ